MQRLSGDLKMPFQLDRELYRKDDTAVHEALVKALVHADHRGQGGMSECRNKSLQLMFHLMGGCSKRYRRMHDVGVPFVVS